MPSKTLYLLLAFVFTIAAVSAFYDQEDDMLTEFQEFKRAKKPYIGLCPDSKRCLCAFKKKGGKVLYKTGNCLPSRPEYASLSD